MYASIRVAHKAIISLIRCPGQPPLHFTDVPVLELGALHAIHVILHRKVAFHRTGRAVTAIDLVDTAEAIAHQAEDPLLVILRALRIGGARPAVTLVQEFVHFHLFVFRGQTLHHFHGLVELIHTNTN